jgi:hypothetical protein
VYATRLRLRESVAEKGRIVATLGRGVNADGIAKRKHAGRRQTSDGVQLSVLFEIRRPPVRFTETRLQANAVPVGLPNAAQMTLASRSFKTTCATSAVFTDRYRLRKNAAAHVPFNSN